MKTMFRTLKMFISIIALVILAAGIALTILGCYEFAMSFSHFGPGDDHDITRLVIIGLLHAVDRFLVAIVFFILAIGIMILFADPTNGPAMKLPGWLHVKNFVELKIILWEAILTTLVVYYIANLVEKNIKDEQITPLSLILPGAVFLIALSLFLVKKGE